MDRLNELLESGKDHSIDVISDLCSQVWSLAEDWRNQSSQVKAKCYR